jgi:photosystem II stability/assembly factor-like uncharacterized protein
VKNTLGTQAKNDYFKHEQIIIMKKIYSVFTGLTLSVAAMAQPASFASRGAGGGGALFSPAFNPANPSEFYISCDMSELFHSTDMGASYSQVHFSQFSGGHNSKVCFTSTSGLLYSISYINDVGTPVKSTDNGLTWTPLTGNPDDTEETYTIDVDYNNSNRVIISYYGEIYFSSNGGNSFTSIHTAASGDGNVVAGVFFDGSNIYIGTNDGVLVSTTGGTSWSTASITGIPSGERIWSFCGGKSGSTTRFFCLTGNVGDVYVGLQGSDYWDFMQGVYACDYGVSNWTAKMSGITVGSDFPMFIGMAGNNINTVYLAGSNDNSEPIVMKTTNAGSSWAHTFLTNNNLNIFTGWSGDGGDRGWGYGECPFGMAVCPTDANYVMIGDFGFPHATSDGGTSWKQLYVAAADQHPMNTLTPTGDAYHSVGIENTTCWQVHWATATNLWACYSDIKGKRSTDGGNSWSFNYTGHNANSMYRVAQSASGTLFAGTSNIHDMYQSTRLQDAILDGSDGNGKIIYSTDNGASWQNLHVFNHPVFWVALDPSNVNRAYASVIHYNGGSGTGGVYRCDNLGSLASSTWTLLPDPSRTEKHPASLVVLNDGSLVATFSGRRDGSGTFTNSSGVFIYNPATNSWTDVSDAGMHYWTKDVVIDPNDPTQNTWYVSVFSGWGGPPNGLGGLYKTTNRGTSWTKLTGSTLDRVTSCTFNPNNADEVYVTTETQGLWRSANINASSPAFALVNSYPFRQPERVFFNPFNPTEMWVTSFGNGMKMGTLAVTNTVEFVKEESPLEIFPNPAREQLTVKAHTAARFRIVSMLGETVLQTDLKEGNNTLDISGLQAGVYLVQTGNQTKKLIVKK